MEFIDDETNDQDLGPSDYGLMNVTRDLQEAMQGQSMAQELDLVSSDKTLFQIILIRLSTNMMNLQALRKGYKN